MSRDWTFFLEDILEGASNVASYTKDMTLDEFRDNRHQYFGIDVNIVWDVVSNKIPVIIRSTADLLRKVRHKKI